MWGNLNESVDGNAGGFLDDTRSGTSGTGDQDPRRQKNIVPVFIKHLLNCKGETLKFGEHIARTVTFLARVLHVEQAATKNTYNLEDDTGKIVAYRWLEAGKNLKENVLPTDTYVRVVGHLRENSGKKHILIQRIWRMSGLNDLTNHYLEILYMCVYLSGATPVKGGVVNQAPSRMEIEGSAMRDESTVGLTKDQGTVFKVIQTENDTENGIDRDTLKSRVPKNVLPQVDTIIDFLISEGHIYSTLSDDYFKST